MFGRLRKKFKKWKQKRLLRQLILHEILEMQRAPEELLDIARMAAMSIPEAKEELKKGYLTEEDLKTAQTRAMARIAREEAARHYGRC